MCLLTHFGELVPWTRDEVQVYLSGQSAFGVEKSTHTWLELWVSSPSLWSLLWLFHVLTNLVDVYGQKSRPKTN